VRNVTAAARTTMAKLAPNLSAELGTEVVAVGAVLVMVDLLMVAVVLGSELERGVEVGSAELEVEAVESVEGRELVVLTVEEVVEVVDLIVELVGAVEEAEVLVSSLSCAPVLPSIRMLSQLPERSP
jgi:hypothetical protein